MTQQIKPLAFKIAMIEGVIAGTCELGLVGTNHQFHILGLLLGA